MKNKTMVDPVFGELKNKVANLWVGTIEVTLFNKSRTLELLVNVKKNDGIEPKQVRAYRQFVAKQSDMLMRAEREIFNYYQSICDEYREQFDVTDPNDSTVPLISNTEQLAHLVTPTGLTFPYVMPKPSFGLLCECTWEIEHGLGVKFVNGKIVEVGYQDIIL